MTASRGMWGKVYAIAFSRRKIIHKCIVNLQRPLKRLFRKWICVFRKRRKYSSIRSLNYTGGVGFKGATVATDSRGARDLGASMGRVFLQSKEMSPLLRVLIQDSAGASYIIAKFTA